MDLKKIKELVRLVEESKISGLSVEIGEMKVDIKKEDPKAPAPVVTTGAPRQIALQPGAAGTEDGASPPKKDENEGLLPITSPMVGTFYRAASPDAPSYVEVGDTVAPGKVVCIIEAMKLFNEIEAEVSGTVAKILVENAKPVEYGQTLMLVKPHGK